MIGQLLSRNLNQIRACQLQVRNQTTKNQTRSKRFDNINKNLFKLLVKSIEQFNKEPIPVRIAVIKQQSYLIKLQLTVLSCF